MLALAIAVTAAFALAFLYWFAWIMHEATDSSWWPAIRAALGVVILTGAIVGIGLLLAWVWTVALG